MQTRSEFPSEIRSRGVPRKMRTTCCISTYLQRKIRRDSQRKKPSGRHFRSAHKRPPCTDSISSLDFESGGRWRLRHHSRRLGRFAARNERALQPSRGRKSVYTKQTDLDSRSLSLFAIHGKMLFARNPSFRAFARWQLTLVRRTAPQLAVRVGFS